MSGDKELDRKLKKLAGKDAKAVVRKAARAVMKPLKVAQQAAAPKRTGVLKRGFKVRSLKRSRKYVGAMITSTLGKSERFYYGGFVELGTKNRNKLRALSFIRGTTQRKKRGVMSRFRQEIATGITRLAKRG